MSAGLRKRRYDPDAGWRRPHVGGLVGASGPATTLIKCFKCGTVVPGVLTCKAGIVPQYVGECPEHKSFGVGLDGSSQDPPDWARRKELPAAPPSPQPEPAAPLLTLNDLVAEPTRALELPRDAIEALSLQCAGVRGAIAAALKLRTKEARARVAAPADEGEQSNKTLSLDEAARRVSIATKTLRNWIYQGKLGGAQGLVYVAKNPRIDWELFAAAFIKRAA